MEEGPNWLDHQLACFYTLRQWQDGRHFPDNIFKSIFLNENVWISIKISLKFVPRCPITNSPALVQIMAWYRPGDKPLSEPMMVSLPTHICITWPKWVNSFRPILTTIITAIHYVVDKTTQLLFQLIIVKGLVTRYSAFLLPWYIASHNNVSIDLISEWISDWLIDWYEWVNTFMLVAHQ